MHHKEYHSICESGRHAADLVTESMFETSSVFGGFTKPHSDFIHDPSDQHITSIAGEHKEPHKGLCEEAEEIIKAVTESMFETSSVFGVLVEPHSELHHHENHNPNTKDEVINR